MPGDAQVSAEHMDAWVKQQKWTGYRVAHCQLLHQVPPLLSLPPPEHTLCRARHQLASLLPTPAVGADHTCPAVLCLPCRGQSVSPSVQPRLLTLPSQALLTSKMANAEMWGRMASNVTSGQIGQILLHVSFLLPASAVSRGFY